MSDSLIDDAVRRASRVEGWMYEEELRWLAEHASRSTSIIEVGIWKGRSTTALCHAAAGRVYAIDHFQGSPEERSWPSEFDLRWRQQYLAEN